MPVAIVKLLGFLGAAWKAVWGFLKLAVTIPLGVMLAAALLGFLLGSCHASDRYKAGYDKGVQAERKAQEKAVKKEAKAEARITAKADKAEVKIQKQIEWRTRTLRQKVVEYVPLHVPAGVVGAGDLVPADTVRLLDAAVRGDEPEPVSVTAGESYEIASGVRFDQLVDSYIVNLGVGRANTAQLIEAQKWAKEQYERDHPP